MPQFYSLFYANYTILATQRGGGHGTMPPPQYVPVATVKLEICFDSGQFVDSAKNLQDQCAEVIYAPKSLSI